MKRLDVSSRFRDFCAHVAASDGWMQPPARAIRVVAEGRRRKHLPPSYVRCPAGWRVVHRAQL